MGAWDSINEFIGKARKDMRNNGTIYEGSVIERPQPPVTSAITDEPGIKATAQEYAQNFAGPMKIVGKGAAPVKSLAGMAPDEAWNEIARGTDYSHLTDDQLIGLLGWNDPHGAWSSVRDLPMAEEKFRRGVEGLKKNAGLPGLDPRDLAEIAEDAGYADWVRKEARSLDDLSSQLYDMRDRYPSRGELVDYMERFKGEMQAGTGPGDKYGMGLRMPAVKPVPVPEPSNQPLPNLLELLKGGK